MNPQPPHTGQNDSAKKDAIDIQRYNCPYVKKRKGNVPICKLGSDRNKKLLCIPTVRDGKCPKRRNSPFIDEDEPEILGYNESSGWMYA